MLSGMVADRFFPFDMGVEGSDRIVSLPGEFVRLRRIDLGAGSPLLQSWPKGLGTKTSLPERDKGAGRRSSLGFDRERRRVAVGRSCSSGSAASSSSSLRAAVSKVVVVGGADSGVGPDHG
jgi:hypothetical protein